jgi:hypothetical protein
LKTLRGGERKVSGQINNKNRQPESTLTASLSFIFNGEPLQARLTRKQRAMPMLAGMRP